MIDEEYYILTDRYIEQFSTSETDIFIFPPFWFDIDNIEVKKEVLRRALKENKLIKDVKGGHLFVEGIITNT